MKETRVTIFILALFFIFLSLCGCGKTAGDRDTSKVVLKINNYEMTANEFKDEARMIMSNKDLDADPNIAKKQLLDEIIMKQLLLQAAQRENFDKDRSFMKEIERYWEQALLKLLIKKKMKEFARKVVAEPVEARQEKMQQELNEWIANLRKKASVKEYDENLKDVVLQ